jgi:hypothetical protein
VISGNYMYHLLNIKETLYFVQRIQLCASYDSQNNSKFIFNSIAGSSL